MTSSYWLKFDELWSDWPARQISGELKWYFLVQLSFWLQQLLAINLEKRRKDYAQMFIHHVVTSFLMYVAYTYRWTKIGNVILVIMDIVDFILPVCKRRLTLSLPQNYHKILLGLKRKLIQSIASKNPQILSMRKSMQCDVCRFPHDLVSRPPRYLQFPLLVNIP